MVNGIATVVRYRDGRTDIVKWDHGPGAPANVWFAKQNLPPIIYEGKLNPNLGDGPEWGETVNNATRVWRSGLGIDAHGNLMYAAANYQTVESLAKVLQRAGAVRAIELDINEDWTSFISYRHPGRPRTEQPAAGNVPLAGTLSDPRRTGFLRRLPEAGAALVRLPRNVSPAAARRRSLLVDALLGVAIGICAIVVAAGIGVVGFFALLCALVIVPWYLLEGGLRGGAAEAPTALSRTIAAMEILVVEDEAGIADFLERGLRAEGYERDGRGRRRGRRPRSRSTRRSTWSCSTGCCPGRRARGAGAGAAGAARAAGDHADREGRGRRPGRGARQRRHRLRHQAVRLRGAAGADPGAPARGRRRIGTAIEAAGIRLDLITREARAATARHASCPSARPTCSPT